MNRRTKKITHGLMITGLLIILASPCFAGLTSLTDNEMKAVTGQSGIRTMIDETMTEEEKRQEEKNNSQMQAIMALNGIVPHELLREVQNIRTTAHDGVQIVREFNSMQQGLLTVPTTVTTIINIPAGLGGGFFF